MSVPTLRAARLVALDWMLEQAANREHESAGPNRSPLIDEINRLAGVPIGSSYCAAAGHYAFHEAGIEDFGGPHTASVGYVEEWARARGYLVGRPRKGDCFCWQIDGDSWPDHFGMVLRVRSLAGLVFVIDTVEANTSSGNAGSQSDGGGWYLRRRTFTRGRVAFVRDPRTARKDPFRRGAETARQAEKRLGALRVWIITRRRRGWSWPRIKSTHNWVEYHRRGGN